MKTCRHLIVSAPLILTGCLFATPAWANVCIPILFQTVLMQVYVLIPVIIIEAGVVILTLNSTIWKTALIVALANIVSTLLGMPLAWILFYLVTSYSSAAILNCLPGRWKPDDETIITRFFDPLNSDFDEFNPRMWWQADVVFLIMLVPFFFSSWFIEFNIAARLFTDVDKPALNDAIYAGNLVTYLAIGIYFVTWGIYEKRKSIKEAVLRYAGRSVLLTISKGLKKLKPAAPSWVIIPTGVCLVGLIITAALYLRTLLI